VVGAFRGLNKEKSMRKNLQLEKRQRGSSGGGLEEKCIFQGGLKGGAHLLPVLRPPNPGVE